MNILPSTRSGIFLTYLLVTFYCFGAAMINEFVEYYSWADAGRFMSAPDFAAWLTASGKIRVPFLVLPLIIDTILAFMLIRYLPVTAPKWILWIILTCHIVAWSSTFIFQLPLELQLSSKGYSEPIMQQILSTDWIRKAAFFVEIPCVVYLARKVFLHKNVSAA